MDSELMLVLMQILSEMHSQFKAFTAPALNWSKSKHGHTFPNVNWKYDVHYFLCKHISLYVQSLLMSVSSSIKNWQSIPDKD